MRKIFISYRRVNAEYAAGALGRELRSYFGDEQVFRDKEDVGGGIHWRQEARRPAAGSDFKASPKKPLSGLFGRH